VRRFERHRQSGHPQLAAAASKAGWLLGCAATATTAQQPSRYLRSPHLCRINPVWSQSIHGIRYHRDGDGGEDDREDSAYGHVLQALCRYPITAQRAVVFQCARMNRTLSSIMNVPRRISFRAQSRSRGFLYKAASDQSRLIVSKVSMAPPAVGAATAYVTLAMFSPRR
jgi:hypothetical protein